LRSEVARDLSDSAYDFSRVVWPAVRHLCGGGELVTVESVVAANFQKDLDTMSGIDAWQVIRDSSVMRGLATRVQWGEKCWRTFTIRKSRFSGARTEYEKRCYAINNLNRGFLIPHLTIQAYVTKRRTGELLEAAVVETEELFRYLMDGLAGQRPAPDGNIFFYVEWDKYRQSGLKLHTVAGSDMKEAA